MENEPAPKVVENSLDARISALEKGQADISGQLEKIISALTPPAPTPPEEKGEEKSELEPNEPSRPFWANFF
jgi:hypothetical protein